MTDLCPECGRPRATDTEGLIAIHCLRRNGYFFGEAMCKDNTITRLRLELAEARAIGELDGAVAALDSLYLRYLHLLSPKNKFDAGKAWGQAFDELHAEASEKRRARAATGEPKEAT